MTLPASLRTLVRGLLAGVAAGSRFSGPDRAEEYRLAVRATDRTGDVQSSLGRAIPPEGARSIHSVSVSVVA